MTKEERYHARLLREAARDQRRKEERMETQRQRRIRDRQQQMRKAKSSRGFAA